MNRDAQIRELNDIYQLLADGRKGYKDAADLVKTADLSALLLRLIRQREGMEDLGAEIRRFKRDDHTQEGTLKGVLHRIWMDMATALGKADDTTVLDECERGEKYLLDRLNTVIKQEVVASSSEALLKDQRDMVEENLAHVEQLRKALGTPKSEQDRTGTRLGFYPRNIRAGMSKDTGDLH